MYYLLPYCTSVYCNSFHVIVHLSYTIPIIFPYSLSTSKDIVACFRVETTPPSSQDIPINRDREVVVSLSRLKHSSPYKYGERYAYFWETPSLNREHEECQKTLAIEDCLAGIIGIKDALHCWIYAPPSPTLCRAWRNGANMSSYSAGAPSHKQGAIMASPMFLPALLMDFRAQPRNY